MKRQLTRTMQYAKADSGICELPKNFRWLIVPTMSTAIHYTTQFIPNLTDGDHV